MTVQSTSWGSWVFTEASPSKSDTSFFRADLRQIAGEDEHFNLPWRDDMYLVYPSAAEPSWKALLAHVRQLNTEADENTRYKILYIMRRAHKVEQPEDVLDPGLDDEGREQCELLRANLERAMHSVGLPPPEVIVTSPLARALETTARGIAPLFPSVDPIVFDGLRERLTNTGKNKRYDKARILQRFPSFDVQNVDEFDGLDAAQTSLESVETYGALWQRVHGVLSHVFGELDHESVILIMSHCYVEQTIQREIAGWNLPEEKKRDAVEFFVGEAGGYAMVVKGTRHCL